MHEHLHVGVIKNKTAPVFSSFLLCDQMTEIKKKKKDGSEGTKKYSSHLVAFCTLVLELQKQEEKKYTTIKCFALLCCRCLLKYPLLGYLFEQLSLFLQLGRK